MGSSDELAAGPAIARTIELAASLAVLTARVAGRADLAERARSLERQARPLAEADAAAYSDYLRTRSEEDRVRTIELHRIANSPHHDGFAMVYVPGEKILVEADAFTPADAAAPAPATAVAPPATAAAAAPRVPPSASPATVNLYQNIMRLKLNVAQIVQLHGPRVATLEELAKLASQAGTQ